MCVHIYVCVVLNWRQLRCAAQCGSQRRLCLWRWLVGRPLLYMDMQTDGPGTGIILSPQCCVQLTAQYNIPFSSAPVLYIHKQFCTTLCYMRCWARANESHALWALAALIFSVGAQANEMNINLICLWPRHTFSYLFPQWFVASWKREDKVMNCCIDLLLFLNFKLAALYISNQKMSFLPLQRIFYGNYCFPHKLWDAVLCLLVSAANGSLKASSRQINK